MLYCSKQDLIDRFSEEELISLTDHDGLSMINDQVIDQAIADASAIMDGYLGSRYQLPLASIPKSLKPLACNMTRYQLYDDQASEQVTKRNEAAHSFLKSVSKGEISLGISDGGQSAQSTDFAEIESASTVFNRDESKSFI